MLERSIPAKNHTSWNRIARAFAALALVAACATARAGAQAQAPGSATPPSPSAAPSAAPGGADCAIVGADEIAGVLGYAVGPADEASRSGGVCFYSSRAMSQDGTASYAIVGNDRVAQRRAYYAVLARRCAGVQAGASHAGACKTFVELSQVKDIDGYFAARTDFPNAEAVKGLGDSAIAAGDALYVKRGDVVYEVVVRRGDALDIDRATALAKLLLARTTPSATPEPSPAPRRPKPT